MRTNEELKNVTTSIALFIINDKAFEPYRWTTTWISGSNTEVCPVECGYDKYNDIYYISIQLDTSKPYWYAKIRSLLKRIRTNFKDYEIKPNIYRYDGSCPDELTLCIK